MSFSPNPSPTILSPSTLHQLSSPINSHQSFQSIPSSTTMTVTSSISGRKPPITLPGQSHTQNNRVKATAALFERVASHGGSPAGSNASSPTPNRLPEDRRHQFIHRLSSQSLSVVSSFLIQSIHPKTILASFLLLRTLLLFFLLTLYSELVLTPRTAMVSGHVCIM